MLANKPLAKYDPGTVEKMNNVLKCEMYHVLVMKMTKQKIQKSTVGAQKAQKNWKQWAIGELGRTGKCYKSYKSWEVLQEPPTPLFSPY